MNLCGETLWTLTILRMRAVVLGALNVYSVNHNILDSQFVQNLTFTT